MPDWNECDTFDTPTSLDTYVDQNTRYLQYKAILSSADEDFSPLLYEVSFSFSYTIDAVEDVPVSAYQLHIEGRTIHYSLPGKNTAKLSVFDVTGRQIDSRKISGTGSLDIAEQPEGLYFLRLVHDDGSVVHKVVVTD